MKYILHILAINLCTLLSLQASNPVQLFKSVQHNHTKHIALVIAFRNFQSEEYKQTKRELGHSGFSVTTVSTKTGLAKADDGSFAKVEKTIFKLKISDYDAIILIGGQGAHSELDKESIYSVMRNAYNQGKIVGAICYSPRILAKAGLLQGKRATGWNEDNGLEEIFRMYGVLYISEPVVIDDRIVTADGPESAKMFGKAISNLLINKKGK
jgi:protease I